MKKTLVSVIIPVYNTEKYLRECLDSIVNQTLKDIEIIIVNDGSTDNSLEIINEYAEKDSRIYTINIPNRGLSIARNVGMSKASGEYIYFIDSDDVLQEDALCLCVMKCLEDNLDLLFFDAETFTDGDVPLTIFKYKRTQLFQNKTYSGISVLYTMFNNANYSSSACLLFIKQSYLRELKLFFYPYIIHEDELFTFILFLKAKRVGLINRSFYRRRLRPNSIMTSEIDIKSVEGYFYVCRALYEYIDCSDTSNEEIILLKKNINRLIQIFLRCTSKLPENEADEMLLKFKKELEPYYGKK